MIPSPLILRIVIDQADRILKMKKNRGQLQIQDIYSISICEYYTRQIDKYPNEKLRLQTFGTDNKRKVIKMYQTFGIIVAKQLMLRYGADHVGNMIIHEKDIHRKDIKDLLFSEKSFALRQGIPIVATGRSLQFLQSEYENYYITLHKQMVRLKSIFVMKGWADKECDFLNCIADSKYFENENGENVHEFDKEVLDYLSLKSDFYEVLFDKVIIYSTNGDILILKYLKSEQRAIIDYESYLLRRKDLNQQEGYVQCLYDKNFYIVQEDGNAKKIDGYDIDTIIIQSGISQVNVITPYDWFLNLNVHVDLSAKISNCVLRTLEQTCPMHPEQKIMNTHTLIHVPYKCSSANLTVGYLYDIIFKIAQSNTAYKDIRKFHINNTIRMKYEETRVKTLLNNCWSHVNSDIPPAEGLAICDGLTR